MLRLMNHNDVSDEKEVSSLINSIINKLHPDGKV